MVLFKTRNFYPNNRKNKFFQSPYRVLVYYYTFIMIISIFTFILFKSLLKTPEEVSNFNFVLLEDVLIREEQIKITKKNDLIKTQGNKQETSIIIEETIKEEEYVKFNHEKYTKDSSIKERSGLTADQINKLLEGTDLHGIGEKVYSIEQDYNIDAFYTISVASLESGYGTSGLAKKANNIFGLTNCNFKSVDSCIEYFGKLMNDYEEKYDIEMTPNGINPRYCELDSWAGKITSLMNKYVEIANELY